MKYTRFTPEEIKHKKKSYKITIIICSVLLALFFPLVPMSIGVLIQARVINISEISYKSIDIDDQFYVEEFTLVDQYYVTMDNVYHQTINSRGLVISFEDKDGIVCYASIDLKTYDEFYDICEKFIEDPERKIGDVVFSGCFSCTDFHLKNSDYFEKAYQLHNATRPGVNTGLTFEYDFPTAEQYIRNKLETALLLCIISAVATIPYAILIIFSAYKIKHLADPVPILSGTDILKKMSIKQRIAGFIHAALFASSILTVISVVFLGVLKEDNALPVYITSFFVFFISGFAYLIYAKPVVACKKILNNYFVTQDKIAKELDNYLFTSESIRCTNSFVLLPGNIVLPIKCFLWVYTKVSKNNFGVTTEILLIVKTPEKRTVKIPLGDTSDIVTFNRMLNICKDSFPKDMLVGLTKENKKRYTELIRYKVY